ncbi:Gamma-glutamylcyclotransferase family protein YtfP [Gimesia panareensis]|uniref:Gamma-glutamylcyclotransferase family protein n=2 Tax=Gimesia panareensis TaxID=2527978 RepID=A0A517Q1I3_9PLAN|nr:Gamma-glutamylcyclotransferase family protein YtfP [Gimesia panareensis]QDU48417.1 Gamma-glutamylcyclotransferase family protein YtfP [Gimesia panareensis]
MKVYYTFTAADARPTMHVFFRPELLLSACLKTIAMPADSHTLIFVYGTLKRGFCRASFLADQQFLNDALTVPHYALFDCGDYPALVKDHIEGSRIHGELWRVDPQGLALLDQVEGVSEQLYARESIELESPVVSATVQAYFYLRDVSRLPRLGDRWTRQT